MNVLKYLEGINGLEIYALKDLSKFSTMRLVAEAPLVIANTLESLVECHKILVSKKKPFIVLGWGANQLLSNSSTIHLKLNFDFDRSLFESARNSYILPANVSLSSLSSHAAKFGLNGWEVFTGIPATLGGAIYMNAGTNLGEIGEIVEWVEVLRKCGKVEKIIIDKESFSYRHNNFLSEGDIILTAKLIHRGLDKKISEKIKNYLELRNKSQPLKEFTCGCIFKNCATGDLSCRAGHIIDIMGLKGLLVGSIQVSEKHGNFFVNLGGGSKDEVMKLIKIISHELYFQLGVKFETEVIL